MPTFTLDGGLPLSAFPDHGMYGLILSTEACSTAACPALHIDAVEVPAGTERLDTAAFQGPDALRFVFNTTTGNLKAAAPAATTWLESARGAWLPGWIAQHADVLHLRYARLKGQHACEPADARPAPPWTPGTCIYHAELFPHDFAPSVVHGNAYWLIADAYCPDPCCTCSDVILKLLGPGSVEAMVSGKLGNPRPKQTDKTSRALWNAVHSDDVLLDTLRERQTDVRNAGSFIVGEAYERARLASRQGTAECEEAGGYLQGGVVPPSLIDRLFKVASRLHAARPWLGKVPGPIHAVVRDGTGSKSTWIVPSEEPVELAAYEEPDGEEPWLALEVVDRSLVENAHRRQRCAHGWPLIAGTSMPLVVRYPADGEEHDAEIAEMRLAIALAEAFLVALSLLDAEPGSACRVFEHSVTLEAGTVAVVLTTSHQDAPWPNDLEDEDSEGDIEDEGDDDLEDEEDSFQERAATALAAFTDAALDRGVASPIVTLAVTLGEELATYVGDYRGDGRWHDTSAVEGFLTEYTPRKVFLADADISRVPEAMHALTAWLGEVGHVDAKELHRVVDRALPVLQRRARDPRQFSMAKALFSEMNAAGVNINDQAAIDRYVAAMNEFSASPTHTDPAKRLASAPNRWRPSPGEPTPGPTAPCPCGSNRRYKKCCMPR